MKTIEEKAKAYDEALKNAMIYYKNGNEDMKMMMKTCFPVLAEESEDERIRKAIGYAIGQSTHSDGTLINGVSSEEALAWLEKQEPVPQWMINFLEDYRPKIGCLLYYEERKEIEGKILAIIKWLEKQGEQKPYGQRQECVDCQFNYAGECKGSCAMKRGERS